MKEPRISSGKIIEALAAKHAGDVFIPECKNGATQMGTHCRLDAWAMKKSWANPLVWGYEVKVSRSDFMGDQKWQSYLKYCNEFYFVCPSGLIDKSELPDEVGLMYVASTGNRLFTKKKAQRRTQVIPEDIYRYILMARASFHREHIVKESKESRLDYWREWLAERKEGKPLGYKVSQAINEHVSQVETENMRLRAENEALSTLKDRLTELGVDSRYGVHTWAIDSALKRLQGQIEPWVLRDLEKGQSAIQNIRKLIEGKES